MTKGQRAAYKAWETMRLKECGGDVEAYTQMMADLETKKEVERQKKEARNLVRSLGGVYDTDYETIPAWAKRKSGRPLDTIVEDLKHNGIMVEDGNEVYEWLHEVS